MTNIARNVEKRKHIWKLQCYFKLDRCAPYNSLAFGDISHELLDASFPWSNMV